MSFKARLNAGDKLYGTMLTLASPEVAEMVSMCDVDWLFLDGEHAPLAPLDWQRVIQATAGRCANLLRIPDDSEAAIKQALDIGADGIIVPAVNSVEQARHVVQCCKYPPQGTRGVGLARAHGYGLTFGDYVARANEELVVIVQAEHIDAVENIEAITAVAGIDCVFIGPYDLSASMGLMGEVTHPDVVAAIDRVRSSCVDKGIALGYFGVDVESVTAYRDSDYGLICVATDAGLLTSSVSQVIDALRGSGE